MIAVIALLSIEDLVKTASTIMIMLFLCLNIAVLTLRFSNIPTYRPPFQAPFFPHLPVISSIVYVLLIIEMGVVPLSITAIFAMLAHLPSLPSTIFSRIFSGFPSSSSCAM